MTSDFNETPVVFACQDKLLTGVFHPSNTESVFGVLIVVGGPQYRVGSHRQFVLLARYLANHGIPVMRFDYRGMGDSSGDLQTYDDVNEDIRVAIDTFMDHAPHSLEKIVIWGLCDAASAGLLYAYHDNRVSALILLNPWVRTNASEAKAYLKHYYLQRFIKKEFWIKVISGKFNPYMSLKSLLGLAKLTRQDSNKNAVDDKEIDPADTLPDRMLASLLRFSGRVLIILSGQDLTADEFRDLIKSSLTWQRVLKNKAVEFKNLPDANHTFSSAIWRTQVEQWSAEWISGLK